MQKRANSWRHIFMMSDLSAQAKTLDFWRDTSDADHMQKRANSARRRQGSRKASLLILPLALGALAIGETWQLGAQCSGEAKVSVERNGPNGTFAEV